MDKKVKVVFIAGYGRSGSTLLDRVLGYSLGACSTGELRHIWERGCLENQLCGCGQKFSECSFWTDVLDAWKKSFSFGDIQEVLQLKNKVDRMRRTPNLLFPMTRSASYRADHQQYSQILLNLYQAIQHRSGCEIIIDSSKDPSYLYLLVSLAKQGLIDLYVIHLVRDSRAVAYSWQRQKKRPEIYWKDEVMPVYSAKKSAFEWLIFNSIISVIRFFFSQRYYFLRYEDFVLDPNMEFQKVVDFLKIESPFKPIPTGVPIEMPSAHTISGNPMRFESGQIFIRPDTEWRQRLSWRKNVLVSAITFPLMLYYGYRL